MLNDDLQFAVCYGFAMLFGVVQISMLTLNYASLQPRSGDKHFAMCRLHCKCFQGRIRVFQFALCMSMYCTVALKAFSLNYARYMAQQCNAVPVTCNLWCVKCIMWYCGELWRISLCTVQVLLCDNTLCKLQYTVLQ